MSAKTVKFEDAMNRLNEIVNELEQNEKPLDESIQLFEEGLKLVRTCNDRLKQYEEKVQDIMKENDGGSDEN